jgi:hypothetical protein
LFSLGVIFLFINDFKSRSFSEHGIWVEGAKVAAGGVRTRPRRFCFINAGSIAACEVYNLVFPHIYGHRPGTGAYAGVSHILLVLVAQARGFIDIECAGVP